MDNRGFNDIDYNMLVDYKGNIYEGRGWDIVGSHIANHNTPMIGICFIGENGDLTPEAKHSILWLYTEATKRGAGRLLKKTYHSAWDDTDCPGTQIKQWVTAGMPAPALPHPVYPGKVLRKGATGDAVKTWQIRMRERGWRLMVDGVFGPETQKVVNAFQKEKGLKVLGYINIETWNAAWTAPITK